MSNSSRSERGTQRTDDRIAQMTSEDRGTRGASEADLERKLHTGTVNTVDELAELNFDEFQQEALPNPPPIPGFHLCWLSTTNAQDSIQKRMRLGYTPVVQADVPGFEVMKTSSADGQDGLIRCNEMALFKIPLARHQAIMRHFHHELPLADEQSIREKIDALSGEDGTGRDLLYEEDGFKGLVNKARPQFAEA